MADIPVQIIISAKDQASSVLKKVGGTAAKTGKDFASLKKDAVIASAGILAVGVGAWKLASDAAKFESVQDAFRGMTEGMIKDQDEFVQKVKESSRGTLSSMDIMRGGTKALALIGKKSFSDFGTDFAKMAELSKKAARATGQDVNFMFDSLITGTARSSKMILDNLGITLDMAEAQSKYKDTIMETTGATELEAEKASLLKTVIEKLDETYKDVAVSSGGLAGAQQEMKATMADLKIEIGTKLLPVFNELLRTISPLAKEHVPRLAEGMGDLLDVFMKLPKEAKILTGFLVAALPVMVALGIIITPLVSLFKVLAFVIGMVNLPLIAIGIGLAVWGVLFTKSIERFGKGVEDSKKFLSDFRQAWENTRFKVGVAIAEMSIKIGVAIAEMSIKINEFTSHTNKDIGKLIEGISFMIGRAATEWPVLWDQFRFGVGISLNMMIEDNKRATKELQENWNLVQLGIGITLDEMIKDNKKATAEMKVNWDLFQQGIGITLNELIKEHEAWRAKAAENWDLVKLGIGLSLLDIENNMKSFMEGIRPAWNRFWIDLAWAVDDFRKKIDDFKNSLREAFSLGERFGGLRGGGRQFGGPVMPGVAYTVGEAGPETFMPMVPGRIIPSGGEGGMSQSNYIEQVIIQSPMDIDTFMRQLSFELKTRGV